jgi:hypothetical protein
MLHKVHNVMHMVGEIAFYISAGKYLLLYEYLNHFKIQLGTQFKARS